MTKKERKVYMKEWYKNNKERQADNVKRWGKDNKDRVKENYEKRKASGHSNKYMRNYNKIPENREKMRARCRKYAKKNYSLMRLKHDIWYNALRELKKKHEKEFKLIYKELKIKSKIKYKTMEE